MADLAASISDVPLALRAVVGLIGALLTVAGARWYRWGLGLAAFGTGAALVAWGIVWLATWLPLLADRSLVAVGAVVGGLATAWTARLAHKVAMLSAGALTGLVVGAAAVQWLLAPVWVALITAALGALVFSWLYQHLLKVLTPAVGAAMVAWAVGLPDNPFLLGGIWAFGAVVQSVGSRPAQEGEGEE